MHHKALSLYLNIQEETWKIVPGQDEFFFKKADNDDYLMETCIPPKLFLHCYKNLEHNGDTNLKI